MKQFFLSSLSKAINSYLALDPESRDRANKLADRIIQIELLPFQLKFICLFTADGIQISSDYHEKPDVTLRGTPLQLLGASLAKENRHRFFAEDLTIEGNAELAQQITELFDHMQIDWEEHLAKFTGDQAAYRIGRLTQRAGAWLRQASQSLTADISEYLHEEKEWFPTREALSDFFNDIDTLRMDVDRAEAKLAQLHANLNQDEVNK